MSVNPCVFYLRNISRTWAFHTTSTAFILVQVITFWMTVKVFWVVALLLLWTAIYFPVKMQVILCHSSVNPLLDANLTESPNWSLFAYLYSPTRTPSTSPILFLFLQSTPNTLSSLNISGILLPRILYICFSLCLECFPSRWQLGSFLGFLPIKLHRISEALLSDPT